MGWEPAQLLSSLAVHTAIFQEFDPSAVTRPSGIDVHVHGYGAFTTEAGQASWKEAKDASRTTVFRGLAKRSPFKLSVGLYNHV